MVYVVAYTLTPKRDATSIIQELQKSASWMHYLDDTWLVYTRESAQQLYNRIAPRFIQSDRFLVVQFLPQAAYTGWLPKEAWDWVQQVQKLPT